MWGGVLDWLQAREREREIERERYRERESDRESEHCATKGYWVWIPQNNSIRDSVITLRTETR